MRFWLLIPLLFLTVSAQAAQTIAYVVSDARIPFWQIMYKGIQAEATNLGYDSTIYSAANDAKKELQNMQAAINSKPAGIVLSPTNSLAAVTLLMLAEEADIPVVISDIGTDGGEFVSFVSSNNFEGAYQLGLAVAELLKSRSWDNGSVGIIAIPQKRKNGLARTQGFLKALNENNISSADIRQQADFSYQETYDFTSQLLTLYPNMRAVWLQGSDRYQAALDAMRDKGRTSSTLLICFDSEPEFVDLINNGILGAAGMQQPFVMGESSVKLLADHLNGKSVPKNVATDVLTVTRENISKLLPTIQRNVLGQTGN